MDGLQHIAAADLTEMFAPLAAAIHRVFGIFVPVMSARAGALSQAIIRGRYKSQRKRARALRRLGRLLRVSS